MNRTLSSLIVLALILIASAVNGAPIILSATKVAGNASPVNLIPGGLVNLQALYTDSPALLMDLPLGLAGGDIVQTSFSDGSPQLIDITLATPGLVYVAVEDTHAQPLGWFGSTGSTDLPGVFVNTGYSISIDADADLVADGTMSLWSVFAGAGTYHLGAGTGANNIGIFAAHSLPSAPPVIVTEPSSLAIAAVGALCCLGLVRTSRNRGGVCSSLASR